MVENAFQIKSEITINVSVNIEIKKKKHHGCDKDYIWNPTTCTCENGKYLASISDDLVITCDEIIE